MAAVSKILRNASASALAVVLRGLLATVRYRVSGYENARAAAATHGGFVLAIWHEAIMVGLGHDVRRGATALVSPGGDGTFAARLVAPFGVKSVRGSTSRRAAEGVLGLLKERTPGGAVVVTPDGPRGPRRVPQDGAAYIASRAGIPIVPVGVAVRGRKRLGSWDRFLIPLPFAAARLIYGDPIFLPRDADRETLKTAAADLGLKMAALTAAAAADLGIDDV